MKRDWKIGVTTVVFFCVAFTGMFFHELWRDEYQAWMLGHDNRNFSDLIQNTRYDGHPLLWHSILFVISHLGFDIKGMQALNLLLATTNVWLIFRYSPFKFYQSVMVVFGYFLCYEYAVISRNYSLTLFFLLVFVIIYHKRKENLLLQCIALFFLANCHMFGLLISFGICGYLLGEFLFEKKQFTLIKYWVFLIPLAGGLIAFFHMLPPADANYMTTGSLTRGFKPGFVGLAVGRFVTSYMPVWRLGDVNGLWYSHFWYNDIWDSRWWAGAILLAFSICSICKSRKALMFYLFTTGMMLMCYYLTGTEFHSYRYISFLFILYVFALWFYFTDGPKESVFSRQFRKVFFHSLLIVQLIGTIIAYRSEVLYKFSNSEDTANFLRNSKSYKSRTIVATRDFVCSSVAGAMNKPFYYIETRRFGTYIKWNTERHPNINHEDMASACRTQLSASQSGVILLTNGPILTNVNGKEISYVNGSLSKDITYRLTDYFDDECICADEKFYIYDISKR